MRLPALILLLISAACLVAQNDSPSLADAARKTRESKAKAKIVVTEETIALQRGPLPDLNIEGVDNSDEVIKAIDKHRQSHTPAETEQVVREWYNRYDMMFQRAFTENEEMKARAQDRFIEPRQYSDNYRQYQEQRVTELHSALMDQRSMQKNNLLIARIQQSLQKIRNGIQSFNLRYEWMKIRFGNGNGSW